MAEIGVHRARNRPAYGVWEPGREETVRRPLVQLQQTRPARGQHQRRAARVHKAETVAAHRRGTYLHNIIINICMIGTYIIGRTFFCGGGPKTVLRDDAPSRSCE